MAKKKFWEDGIRFECQGTGRCCLSRGSYGFVYLTLHDRKRLAKALKLPTAAFTRKFCGKTDGHAHLKNPEKDCPFLDGEGCSVYEARPAQCRTWPFWPENLTPKAWTKEVTAFCPGVGKGRVWSAEEIREQLRQDPVNPLKD